MLSVKEIILEEIVNFRENKNHGKLKSTGKRFWIGIASVYDGEIEEVHTYEEA